MTPIASTPSRSDRATPVSGSDTLADERIDAACAKACSAIAPAWPLDRSIAVNPHWGRIDRPLREVAARMAVLAGIAVFPSREFVREAWRSGRIGETDLAQALAAAGREAGDAATCIAALDTPSEIRQLPLLIDILDDDPRRHTRLSWRQAITHQVSQTCAAYFDRNQADWQPDHSEGLYAFWRDTLTHDHGIGTLMGLPALGRALGALPATRREAEAWVMERLGLPEPVWADYLEAVLLTVNGWASWCAWLGWQARQEDREDAHLRDLLAIRLAWGAVLLECKTDASAQKAFAALHAAWCHAPKAFAEAEAALWIDEIWQHALDIGYQRELARRLSIAAGSDAPAAAPEVQAVFCIDVRSERLRRALEAVWPAIQTRGFAGFFGLPIAYTPFATDARRPQLPGLLAPALEVTECFGPDDGEASGQDAAQSRRRRLAWAGHWRSGSRWPAAAYSYVEAAGIGYVGALARWLRPSAAPRVRDDLTGLTASQRTQCRPALTGLDAAARVQLAARVLRAMELDRGLAPLVLLVGHGSQSANNAQAAALDCGACCGQSGEVNARVLADLLNDATVREGLAQQGITVPAATRFVAALHNTTTDEIEWFDADGLSGVAGAALTRVREAFAHACDQVRRERAALLGLDARATHNALLERLRRRANDGAQTRPEWGLAGNAAFVIAPRACTRDAVLDGRVFLHDYDAAQDADGKRLEALMTAPMLVAHWINWQYHASTCDPERLGSGNKLLHNVVGGHLGVFEGNGGDLRIGLSRQSLHDGERWMHEPLRLTVVIAAPREAIDRIINAHAVVRKLVNNGWLHLWRLDDGRIEGRTNNGWKMTGSRELSH
ncbi:MAG: DUF2309 domain-containing protein [Pseudazoarcus pumilus]|nr:DUF2309 domain-containing protein [Pseudazoarcus pumilus]